MPKHVVTSSLTQGKAEVSRLKEQPGRDILLYASGSLVDAPIDNDLIDELRLWIIPVVVGNGQRLFGDRTDM